MFRYFLFLAFLAAVSFVPQSNASLPVEQKAVKDNEFYLSVLVDFPDDAAGIHYTPEKVEQMMSIYKEMGIKRVYWAHYGGARCHWSGSNENLRLWEVCP